MKPLLFFLFSIVFVLSLNLNTMVVSDMTGKEISVTIEGEVANPGEYHVAPYSTLAELLEQAVLNENADVSMFNPMMTLQDKDLVRIPAKKEEQVLRVSINTGTTEELVLLPGIGETMALRIITYRNEFGLFQELSDLKNVKGIGERKFSELEPFICL